MKAAQIRKAKAGPSSPQSPRFRSGSRYVCEPAQRTDEQKSSAHLGKVEYQLAQYWDPEDEGGIRDYYQAALSHFKQALDLIKKIRKGDNHAGFQESLVIEITIKLIMVELPVSLAQYIKH